jgi:hypothetical protein
LKLAAVQLEVAAGRGLVEARYRGPPLSVDVSGTMYATPDSRESARSLGSRSTAAHLSGDASVDRPLQPIPQLSDEIDEMSSAAFSTYTPIPLTEDHSMVSGRGKMLVQEDSQYIYILSVLVPQSDGHGSLVEQGLCLISLSSLRLSLSLSLLSLISLFYTHHIFSMRSR